MRLKILMSVAAIGCASGTPVPETHPATVTGDETVLIRLAEQPEGTRATISASPDKIWNALPLVYSKLGVTGAQVLDANNLVYGVREYKSSRLGDMRTAEIVRCGSEGSGPSAGAMYRRTLNISSSVYGNANGTTILSSEIGGYASPVEGVSTEAIRCESNGKLEKQILALVKQQLGLPR